ncbi:MAG TPA: pyridoxal phosphate-dependent aminotransferase [Candidatus Faecaligallichristensenella faecipullorum]|nr:pyridoxal phosphate-dependent aminotransferase [Candidatus Faecaligallichristensenella faecipullorum]
MYSQQMYALGSKRSIIREIFEYAKVRSAEIGADKVFDFSLGNPNVPAPEAVKETLLDLIQNTDPVVLHGYTSAQGDFGVRDTIAKSLNRRFGTQLTANHLYMTVGAAASISICCRALSCPGDEFITFAPYFTEYQVFVECNGASLKVVPAREPDFQIDFEAFKALINERTKAVIINSPNNPSGVVYSEATIVTLCDLLREKSAEYGHPIYLITDEPYREIVYDGVQVPFLINYYDNCLVCYSFSKALSLPGERIGYVAVSNKMQDGEAIYAAVCGAGRALGYVCAPSLFQFLVGRCADLTSDMSFYRTNRDLLYNGLTEMGYSCVKPDGAFYLFVKSPEKDANAFFERAKKYELLLVPGDDFGCPGYVRIAYCVKTSLIQNALPAFRALAQEYGLTK